MKVFVLSTQTVIECNESYGARMIEQGKAVIPPKAEPETEKETPAEEAPAKETKGAKKR